MDESDRKAHELVVLMRSFCEMVHTDPELANDSELEWWVHKIEKKISEVDLASGLPCHGVKRTG